MSAKPHIIVIGAGVIGLQTALILIDSGFEITIVSKHWPGDKELDYTSPSAGVQWRANLRNEAKLQQWDTETFEFWGKYTSQYPAEECGLELKPATLYWDQITDESANPENSLWWSSLVPSFEVMTPDSLPLNSGIAAGVSYKTFCISPTTYLRHLLSRCLRNGAKTYIAEVESVEDVFDVLGETTAEAVGVVNCSGLSARKIAKDETMFPTKGQTITVKGESSHVRTRVGGKWEAWVIPHPGTGTSLIGGCKLAYDWSTNIDEEITQWIIDRCKPLAPDLLNLQGEFDVISVQIARRPSREKGPRVELEWITSADGKRKFVCHNYGHGHSGFENSVGTSNEAANLILQALK